MNTVDGDNAIDTNLTVGYYGSELQSRWIDNQVQDRWVHFLEATMTSHCETYEGNDCYSIRSQRFDTRFYSGTEHNGTPSAGSAAWPNPPGGNWNQVIKEVIETSLGGLRTLVGVALSADDIQSAYNDKGFGTERDDKIQFESSYSLGRSIASHSVNFTADQVPGTDGMVDMLSVSESTGALVYLYPDSGEMNQSPNSSAIETDSTAESTRVRSKYDQMSRAELESRGVKRLNPSEISEEDRRKSRFRLIKSRPAYIKSFDMEIEFESKNGKVDSAEIRKP